MFFILIIPAAFINLHNLPTSSPERAHTYTAFGSIRWTHVWSSLVSPLLHDSSLETHLWLEHRISYKSSDHSLQKHQSLLARVQTLKIDWSSARVLSSEHIIVIDFGYSLVYVDVRDFSLIHADSWVYKILKSVDCASNATVATYDKLLFYKTCN